jgi:hypothetical protein
MNSKIDFVHVLLGFLPILAAKIGCKNRLERLR